MERWELEYAGQTEETSVIENCYNTGNIKVTNDLNISLTKVYLSIGAGIVGMNYGKILSCYNTGDITQNGYRSYNGGIAGRSIGGNIEKCYTSGNILASAAYIARDGGVIGKVENNTTVSNCYNLGDIEVTSNSSYTRIGGVIGEASGKTTITNVYNVGVIKYAGTKNLAIGGVVGSADQNTSITNGFFLNTVAEKICGTGTPTLSNSSAKTEDDLKAQDFILIKDYEDIWQKNDKGYPTLKINNED